ncbi:MAG: hypothetical protein KQH59_12930 [Desulfobulbaceae bacterium]|nr:hypothetical protein [Desulfobulbaceae bacterium]
MVNTSAQRLLNGAMTEPPGQLMVSKRRRVGTFTHLLHLLVPIHGFSIFSLPQGEVYMARHINLASAPPARLVLDIFWLSAASG